MAIGTIKIHKSIGECITLESFCEQIEEIVNQPSEYVKCAMDAILEEQSLVEAMETYCSICGITTY